MYCKNCGRKVNAETTVCPICGAKMMDVVWIKTGVLTRIAALIVSLVAIGFICGGWAEIEVWSFFGTYYKEFSIFDLKDIIDLVARDVDASIWSKYKTMFAFASFSAFVSIVLHICSAVCAIINSKSSGAMRRLAGILTIITIILARFSIGMLESDTENIVRSTWTWVILSIVIVIDMCGIASKVGIKRIDYSKCEIIDKPNLPNESLLDRGGWKCARCSKINASYVNTCSCGGKK